LYLTEWKTLADIHLLRVLIVRARISLNGPGGCYSRGFPPGLTPLFVAVFGGKKVASVVGIGSGLAFAISSAVHSRASDREALLPSEKGPEEPLLSAGFLFFAFFFWAVIDNPFQSGLKAQVRIETA